MISIKLKIQQLKKTWVLAQVWSLACSWAAQQGSLANPLQLSVRATTCFSFPVVYTTFIALLLTQNRVLSSNDKTNATFYHTYLFNTLVAKACLVSAKDKLLILGVFTSCLMYISPPNLVVCAHLSGSARLVSLSGSWYSVLLFAYCFT